MIPRGKGFLQLGREGQIYELSLYHQLHCLDGLRRAFLAGSCEAEHMAWHIHHCLNHLRQSILCAADTTLEPASDYVINGKHTPGASGMNVVHRCRDWEQVREYAERNYDDKFRLLGLSQEM
ncbi:hypothetical protein BS17DRAFT_762184 [Gyrodon lividus]|nr:hypothetical protein BS17DRAFT_762184 [Gyrodon lividus]